MRDASGSRRRVLVVVGNKGIGDVVEALPVFELIHRHWPGASVAAGSFNVSQQIVFARSAEVDTYVRLYGNVSEPVKALRALPANVSAMRDFSDVLFLYKHQAVTWPLGLAARLAGARPLYRHGYQARGRRTTYSDFPGHVFFQMVASELLLGYPLARPLPLRWSVRPDERRFAEALLHRYGLGSRPLVMLNTRGLNTRMWGVKRFAQLARVLVQHGLDVIFNGGTPWQVAEYESVAADLPPQVVLLDRPDVSQLTAVLAQCDLLIGEPSGPTTLAMAVGTRTLSIQGPGEYEYPGQERIGPTWWPRGPEHQVLSGIEWCQLNVGQGCRCLRGRPMSPLRAPLQRVGLWDPLKTARKRLRKALGRSRRRPRVPDVFPCLEAITVDSVAAAALPMLGRVEGVPMADKPVCV